MNWLIFTLLAVLAVACIYAAYLHIKLRDIEVERDYLYSQMPKRGANGQFLPRS